MTGCGVAHFRAAPLIADIEFRLIAQDEHGQEVPRRFSRAPLHVDSQVWIENTHIDEVRLLERPDGARHLVLKLNAAGQAQLSQVSHRHLNRRLAIIVNGAVVSAPRIIAAMDTNEAHITVADGHIEDVFHLLTENNDAAAPIQATGR